MRLPTKQEFAERVAEKVMDEYMVDGKTLREWINEGMDIRADRDYWKAEAIKATAELGEMKIAEEQGLYIKLPCKVGDTVYIPETDDNARVHSIDIYIRTYAGTYRASDFGKTIFATRAAEEALKGEQFKKQQNDCIDAGYVCYRSNCEGCTSEALKGGEGE